MNETYDYIDPKSGLNFIEILMLFYAYKYSTDTEEYERFWEYKYDVSPTATLLSLYNRGYIELDSIKTSLEHLKVPELKTLLKKYELDLSGNKNALVLRLLENLTYDELYKEVPYRYYVLTSKGEHIVNNNSLVLFAHRNPDLNININKAKRYLYINDYLWSKLNGDSLKYHAQEEWGLYRNCRLKMADILMHENNYSNALRFLVEVCYCDSMDGGIWNEKNTTIFAPYVIEHIANIQNKMNYSNDDMRHEILTHIETLNLPYNVYAEAVLADMIIDNINKIK